MCILFSPLIFFSGVLRGRPRGRPTIFYYFSVAGGWRRGLEAPFRSGEPVYSCVFRVVPWTGFAKEGSSSNKREALWRAGHGRGRFPSSRISIVAECQ